MKTTFKFIIAAMAASAVLTSCQKEMAIDNSASSNGGVRVISASFSAPTKSALDTDNKTPKFVGGETVKVSNATASEDCTISVNDGKATFSTTLSGTLTAVYPSTAAKMNGAVIDNSAVLVSTVQDGTFASANIAMATGFTTSATFTNKTAVIKVTPGAGANTKYVEVITAGPEIANNVPAGSAFTKLNKIHVNTTSAEPVYVSILVPSGLKVQNLSFADGSNIKTAKDNTTAIAINTISTVTATGWDKPYVEINGLKWATMNIGATSATEAGKYFMWGETTGITPSGSSFSFPDSQYYSADNNSWDQTKGFAYENCPWTNDTCIYPTNTTVFTKYVPSDQANYWGGTGSPDGKTTLDLADDAANVNWGGSWRMPTKEEFDALCALPTKSWQTNYNGSGVNGYLFTDANGNSIFLPAAGCGQGTDLFAIVDSGGYWSSSLDTVDPDYAYPLGFSNFGGTDTESFYRCEGYSVRALSE